MRDLELTKVVSDLTPIVGTPFSFMETLHNFGPDPAVGVVVSDPLPQGLDFVSADPSRGSYDAATGLWTVGTVPAGGVATLVLTVRATSPGPAFNVAAITASGTADPNPDNNVSESVLDAVNPALRRPRA